MAGSPDIKESDWKLLRKLKPIALERLCKRILTDLGERSEAPKTWHERYLLAFSIISDGDAVIAEAFNDMRRSTAAARLFSMKAKGLITEKEFAEFSEDIRHRITSLLPAQGATELRLKFSAKERDLILEMLLDDSGVAKTLESAKPQNGAFEVSYSLDSLELLINGLAAESNHASNSKTQNEWDALCERLKDIQEAHDRA